MILIGRDHIAVFIQQRPDSRTALAMWQAIAERATWRSAADAFASFPLVSFVTPRIARFPMAGITYNVMTQIAFNTGILIVLAVTEANTPEPHEL
jgi:mRNA-degrading endonuclease HigB of HigAB toxin-antitoxin module